MNFLDDLGGQGLMVGDPYSFSVFEESSQDFTFSSGHPEAQLYGELSLVVEDSVVSLEECCANVFSLEGLLPKCL